MIKGYQACFVTTIFFYIYICGSTSCTLECQTVTVQQVITLPINSWDCYICALLSSLSVCVLLRFVWHTIVPAQADH